MSNPIVLTSDTDASLKWDYRHLQFGTPMPSGTELWPNLGDDGLRKAAYRGGWKPA
jgi:hypothetical protein